MAVQYRGVSNSAAQSASTAGTAGTASVTPTLPASTAIGDRVFIFQSYSGVAGATPTGWTALYKDVIVGTGTVASGSGPRRLTCYYRDRDTAWSMPAVTLTSATNNSNVVAAITLFKDAGETWDTPVATATPGLYFGTAGTAYSATSPTWTTDTGAMTIGHTVLNDNVTSGSPGGSTTGMTLGTRTERADGGIGTGNIARLVLGTASVTTGGTGTITRTATLSAASQGGTMFLEQSVTAPAVTGPTRVQSVTSTNYQFANTTSYTAPAWTTSPVAGNVLLFCASIDKAGGAANPGITAGWTVRVYQNGLSGGTEGSTILVATKTATGGDAPPTITWTSTSQTGGGANGIAQEWANVDTSRPLDPIALAPYTGSLVQSLSVGPLTPDTDSGVVLAFFTTDSMPSGQPASAFSPAATGWTANQLGAPAINTGAGTPGAALVERTAAPVAGTAVPATTFSWTNTADEAQGVMFVLRGAPAVAYRGASSGASPNSASGATCSVPRPTGTVDGDLLIAVAIQDQDATAGTMTAPAGWSADTRSTRQITANGWMHVWTKTAASGDPANFLFTNTSAGVPDIVMGMLAVSGHDTTTPLAVTPTFGYSAAAGTAHAAPSVTGVVGGLLVSAFGRSDSADATATYTMPAGMTERVDLGPTLNWTSLAIGTELLTSAGATGTRTATCSDSAHWTTMSLVVAPVEAAPSTTPVEQTVTEAWDVRQVVTDTAAEAYGVRQILTDSASDTFAVRGAVPAASRSETYSTGWPTPAEILNIGPGSTQNHFELQYAVPPETSIRQPTMAELVAGLDVPPYFTVNAAGTAVQFSARVDAPTTPGSSSSRAELREVDAAGTRTDWDAWTGTHEFHGRTKITATPEIDQAVIIAQLYNEDRSGDAIVIRTQVFGTAPNQVVRLVARINGTGTLPAGATGLDKNGNTITAGGIIPRLADPYVLGTEFEWKIRVENGVVKIFYNDMATPHFTATNWPLSHGPKSSWKAGVYNTAQPSIETDDTRSGTVELRDLTTTHGTSPTPVERTVGESWAVRQSVTATAAEQYAVRGAVPAATRAEAYAVRGLVQRMTAETFSVRSGVAQASSDTWSQRQALLGQLAASWNVSGALAATRAEAWSVRAGVSQALAEAWAVRVTITDTGAETYAVRALVIDTAAEQWSLQQSISRALAEAWAVRSAFARTSAEQWSVAGAVLAERAEAYGQRSAVLAVRSEEWGQGQPVVATRAEAYAVRAPVERTAAEQWSTLAISAVENSAAATWAVRAAVLGTATEAWGTRTTVTAAAAEQWATLATAQVENSVTTSWSTRAALVADAAEAFGVRTPLTRTAAEAYAARGSAAQSRSETWSARALASNVRSETWSTRAPAATTTAEAWGIRNPLQRATAETWAVRGRLLAERSEAYTVQQAVAQPVQVEFIAAGSVIEGVAPSNGGLVSGWDIPDAVQPGDLLVAVMGYRGPGSQMGGFVDGWTNCSVGNGASTGFIGTWARTYEAGDAPPSIFFNQSFSFSNTYLGRIFVFRGAASVGSIAFWGGGGNPGTTLGPVGFGVEAQRGGLALTLGIIGDDFASEPTIDDPAWQSLGALETLAGDDLSLVPYYLPMPAGGVVPAPTITVPVSGGVAAQRVASQLVLIPATVPTTPVEATVGDDWTVTGRIVAAASDSYGVRAVTSDAAADTWRTTVSVAEVVAEAYGVRTGAAAVVAATWRVLAGVLAQTVELWALQGRVVSTAGESWTVLVGVHTSVADSWRVTDPRSYRDIVLTWGEASTSTLAVLLAGARMLTVEAGTRGFTVDADTRELAVDATTRTLET